MELPGAVFSIAGGALLAVAVAATLSPLTPIGPVRRVEAQPGVSFDWTVLGVGGLLVAAALGLVLLVVVLRQSPTVWRSGLRRGAASPRQPWARLPPPGCLCQPWPGCGWPSSPVRAEPRHPSGPSPVEP